MPNKFTPGPWTIDNGEIIAGGMVLGTVYGADDYPCAEDDLETECAANARLIAAAPELFAALQALLTVSLPRDVSGERFIAQAIAAIAKATASAP